MFEEQIDDLAARLEEKKADLRDLATMGAVVTSIHEINAVLSVAMDMSIRLVGGEVGSILLDSGGVLKNQISWGIREDFIKTLKFHNDRELSTHVFEVRETVILRDQGMVTPEGMRVRTTICLPIQTAHRCFGVLLVINKENESNYTDEDREILEMLMNFVAVAIDNSLLMKDKLKRQKVEQEMAIAKQVQETILPQDIDGVKGAEIGTAYFPAMDVGGDFYDIVKIDESRFVVVIGDVSNKGVPAALIMSAAAGIIKSALDLQPNISVSELAGKTNEMLASGIIKHREMFVTLFFARYDLKERVLTFCNAGHVPGLLWDSKNQKVVELSVGGPIVGQFPNIKYKEGTRPLEPGDRLFLFTDGLTEATDRGGQLFGRQRVEQVFQTEINLSPKQFCLKVKGWIDSFTEGCAEDTIDDFTIVQVRT
ncbi:MAG: GAF domain-containing SpoIIE family protein phosphatase [Candidatus Zixiibacteriota bacterium]